jgi:hypothetical protein
MLCGLTWIDYGTLIRLEGPMLCGPAVLSVLQHIVNLSMMRKTYNCVCMRVRGRQHRQQNNLLTELCLLKQRLTFLHGVQCRFLVQTEKTVTRSWKHSAANPNQRTQHWSGSKDQCCVVLLFYLFCNTLLIWARCATLTTVCVCVCVVGNIGNETTYL